MPVFSKPSLTTAKKRNDKVVISILMQFLYRFEMTVTIVNSKHPSTPTINRSRLICIKSVRYITNQGYVYKFVRNF